VANTVYRSVKLVVQNSTNGTIVVQGVATLTGDWAPRRSPYQDQVIPEQSAVEWMSQSTQLGVGSAAYVRLACSGGYVTISWNLPWTGRFTADVTRLGKSKPPLVIDDAQPDNVVIVVAIEDAAGA